MEYCYNVKQGDSFYTNSNYDYLVNNSKIIGIKKIYGEYSILGLLMNTFDCDTKTFTSTEVLHKVEYKDLKQFSCYFIDLIHIFLIDVENGQYTVTDSFPFMISEIDGNCVESCHNNSTIYIFHSETDNYETGVFIFDIKTNKFNYNDYQKDLTKTIKYTNRFSNLNNKTVTSCSMYNDIIYVLWHDKDNEDLMLSKYNPINDEFTDIFSPIPTETWYKDLIVVNNKAYIKGNNLVCIYDIYSHELLEKLEIYKNGYICYSWFIRDDYLVFYCKKLSENYDGQICKIMITNS